MKTSLLLFLLILFASSAIAQQPDEVSPDDGRLYIGAGITTIPYHIYYKERKNTGLVRSGYFTPITIALRYELSERASVQVSIGYGGDTHEIEGIGGTFDNPVHFTARSRTNAIAFPVSGQFILLNAFKRFPVYATASMIPVFGTTKASVTENSIVVSDTKDKGMDIFAIAGLGGRYKISNRFTGYLEYYFFKKNLTGGNSMHYDWEQFATRSRRIYKSLALGVNYRLQKVE
ncbi:hypothetical protein DXT99_17470 [Pontibacter diazotrophicus]|uniref:Outer membrane protein beta-barrel domain-containing protein n=1 Tax=Pontibacter diazotrophicus TaxID=1400979 RepID=A0A3D8L8T5_9BACT|nr:outer membrane beta-barrel protein [Pontibacter diazotrophicus]RDV13820.1 hypothetical protein DXT99_17470 [Pontibacter diazotrophicus]